MLPYQGNKSVIAKDICLWLKYKFPEKSNFYDLFGGGGAIIYEAIKHYKSVHYNEILPHIYLAVESLLNGTYYNILPKDKWISREEFTRVRTMEDCAYKGLVLACWSFGNNQSSYIYGQDIEEWKKAVHNICFAKNVDTIIKSFEIMEQRVFTKPSNYTINFNKSKAQNLLNITAGSERRYALKYCIESRSLERLQSLENLERLQSLESLERLERLETSNTSYENVIIKPNSLVYCDIPYNTKHKAGNYTKASFDHESFYNWALNNKNTIVFSEYEENVPSDFIIIWKKPKRNLMVGGTNLKSNEILAWNGK